MGSSAPQAPPPPDPYRVAGAQTGQNVQSAIANSYLGNVDQVGPYGSTTYKQGGTYAMTGLDGQTHQVPRFTQTTTLAPEQQKLYDQQTQLGQASTILRSRRRSAWPIISASRLTSRVCRTSPMTSAPTYAGRAGDVDRVAAQNQRDYDAPRTA